MRISVVSPSRQTGTTTVTTLIAALMSQIYKTRTLLTYTGLSNQGMSTYLSLDDRRDLSRSLTQVKALRQTRALDVNDIYEYCTHITKFLSVLDMNAVGIKETTANEILSTCLDGTEGIGDFYFTDVTTEIYDKTTQGILKSSDIILVVLTQDKKCYDTYLNWKTSEYFKPYLSKCLFCFNKFNPVIGAERDAAKAIFEKSNRCFKIDYNPYIPKMCNKGKIVDMVPYIQKSDLSVYSLSASLREGVKSISSSIGYVNAW